MTNSSRQHSLPLIIHSPEMGTTLLEPVDLTRPPFREDTLQLLLATHPSILPVAEIEPAFAPTICLGREIPTPSGYLDVLYLNPTGYLTLVEAKLWDNPQSRREVVGQIIDYAKDFSRWTFEDLDAAVRRANKSESKGILDLVRQNDPDLDEAAFIDTVTRTLQRGAFLLLIVGNGIREGLESLTQFLQKTPSLHFALALVELSLYRLTPNQPWPLLVQPRTVARTIEVTRAVVEVHAPKDLQVTVTLPSNNEEDEKSKRKSLTEDAFFDKLSSNTSTEIAAQVEQFIKELRELGLVSQWRNSGVSMRLPDPNDLGWKWTVVFLTTAGTFWLAFLKPISDQGGYDSRFWIKYLESVKRITGIESSTNQIDATKEGKIFDLLENREMFLGLVETLIEDLRGSVQSSHDVNLLQ